MIRVEVTDANGRRLASQSLARWMERHAPSKARGRVVVAIVPDATMRRFNKQFRKMDYATDVLSFPSIAPGELGEIAIASGVTRRQAREAGHAEAIETRILALHGLLHLMGYDHETDAGEMRRTEERLRKRAGLPAGLIDRTGSDAPRRRRSGSSARRRRATR
jgi:probable rRNA maturation factor